uniref:Skp1-related protein n=1 Tax=Panagrolaimus sp. JU765 TaxID=591449 RepID=A0AC34RT65_9BILA
MKNKSNSEVYTLISSDGQEFKVSDKILQQSEVFNDLKQNCGSELKIPIPDIAGETLSKIVEFCRHYENDEPYIPPNRDIPIPDIAGETLSKIVEFCRHYENDEPYIPPNRDVDEINYPEPNSWEMKFLYLPTELFEKIILGANYLNIQRLIDACCFRLGLMIQGRSVEEIRTVFDIPNDFSSDEEENMRREHIWYDCPVPERFNHQKPTTE